uniref:Uncharacterized protein n=1 Tax=Arundo donax TaxID=35708 RepID=A0A0A9BVY8_ARUDO
MRLDDTCTNCEIYNIKQMPALASRRAHQHHQHNRPQTRADAPQPGQARRGDQG